MKHIFPKATLVVVLLAGAAAIVLAGPLDPPAGPVASTYKTLAEIEPRIALSAATTPGDADSTFKITQRGSFYLTSNLTGLSNKVGIEIDASDVTLDLSGYRLIAGQVNTLSGIRVNAPYANITIRNGTIENWHDNGVSAWSIRGVRLIELHAINCGGYGFVIGEAGEVRSCFAWTNAIDGIVTGYSCTVTDCQAIDNGAKGIFADSGSTITHCTAKDNDDYGIGIGEGGTISECASIANWLGFYVPGSSIATACSARESLTHGFDLFNGASANRCTSAHNGQHGFYVGSSSLVLECNAFRNGVTSSSAGIFIYGYGARIDGNHVNTNDFGIRGSGTNGCVIVRNSASNNPSGNFAFLINNDLGPVGAAATATSPWANITD